MLLCFFVCGVTEFTFVRVYVLLNLVNADFVRGCDCLHVLMYKTYPLLYGLYTGFFFFSGGC